MLSFKDGRFHEEKSGYGATTQGQHNRDGYEPDGFVAYFICLLFIEFHSLMLAVIL